jgi:hypothetical protein
MAIERTQRTEMRNRRPILSADVLTVQERRALR